MVYLLHDPFFKPWAALFFGHISLLSYLTVIKIPSYSVTFSALQACKYLIINTCHVTVAKTRCLEIWMLLSSGLTLQYRSCKEYADK